MADLGENELKKKILSATLCTSSRCPDNYGKIDDRDVLTVIKELPPNSRIGLYKALLQDLRTIVAAFESEQKQPSVFNTCEMVMSYYGTNGELIAEDLYSLSDYALCLEWCGFLTNWLRWHFDVVHYGSLHRVAAYCCLQLSEKGKAIDYAISGFAADMRLADLIDEYDESEAVESEARKVTSDLIKKILYSELNVLFKNHDTDLALKWLERGFSDMLDDELRRIHGDEYWNALDLSEKARNKVQSEIDKKLQYYPPSAASFLQSPKYRLSYLNFVDWANIVIQHWDQFGRAFQDPRDLKWHCEKLLNYRNFLRHPSDMAAAPGMEAQSLASMRWLKSILDNCATAKRSDQ